MVGLTCTASGDGWSCDKARAGNGLCNSHYWQSRNKPALTKIQPRIAGRWKSGRRMCGSCEVYLDPSEFSVASNQSDGLASECKTCAKDRQLRINFNMTLEQYHELLAAQDGVCAICGEMNEDGKALAVDHDHDCCPGKKTCGKCTRKLLCSTCNQAIGLLRDNSEVLRKAAQYLEEFGK